MFKAFSPRILIVITAWFTTMLYLGLSALWPMIFDGPTFRAGHVIAGVQLVFTVIFMTPLWRHIWRWVPRLNQLVYPDLNGEWDVELQTNWPRIDAVTKAACGAVTPEAHPGETRVGV